MRYTNNQNNGYAGLDDVKPDRLLAAFTGNVFAAGVIELKKGVKFNHKAHQELLKDCTKCHTTPAGGKIEGFGKDFAHKTCKGCHAAGKGPTACKECHK